MVEDVKRIERNLGLLVFRIFASIVSLILAIYYSNLVYIQNDADLFSSHKVPISTWLPCVLFYFVFGVAISGWGKRSLKTFLLLWPLIHMGIFVFGLALHIGVSILMIFPPFVFIGETIAFGALLTQLFYRDSTLKKIIVILVLVINLFIIYFGIDMLSSDQLSGF